MKTHTKPKRLVSSRKVAAARANGKLGGRPRNAARNATPHLFVGHFGFDATKPDATETQDGRFTAVVEARDVHAAVRAFRRLLRQPFFRDGGHFKDVQIDLLSVSEIRRMPLNGFVSFYELIMRDATTESGGGICGAGLGFDDADKPSVAIYGFAGPFIKGPKPAIARLMTAEADTAQGALASWHAARADARSDT